MSGFHAIHVHNSEHYTWGEMCDGWHLVKDDRLSVIEEEIPPQAAERRHFHRKSQQFFYVLDGEAELEIEGIRVHLLRGQGVHVPPEACHQMRNLSSAPVRFLVISEPPSHGDRVSYIKPESEHHTIENMKGDS